MVEEKEIVKTSRFMLMEAADNAQILAEIDGEMLKAMVYRYKGKDRLSYAGAKFAAIKLENIHVKESTVTYNKDLDQFEASALALNENINLTLPGFAEQPRLMKVWDNKQRTESHLEVDEFARRKAAGKAVRNALMAVMPADHIAAYMRAAIDKGNVKTIKNIDVEQVPAKKPKARVGDPPRRTPKPATESKTESEEEKPPDVSSWSVDSVREKLAHHILGLDEWIIVSSRPNFIRVGKHKKIDDEMNYMVSELVKQMGGDWNSDKNEWQIFREEK